MIEFYDTLVDILAVGISWLGTGLLILVIICAVIGWVADHRKRAKR
jgi:hypothetical protein